ncbi:TPA: S-layer protein SlpA [Clostridioides difficile]|nr:precursor of the S-layer proteins [Clostridioides difficile]HAU5071945.1 S-layer protein SlpA [Clostridioides difficile]HAU5233491.1 S-layer protein SlpA [Clostridioides difficile]HAU5261881.1 S-layer protein SlpA [Clostridioides difficile]HAU5376895.1 S-layer protein SlpA [Clostridioides difficile]
MNKKNIAIAMSGLTVLASAAPVFAAEVKDEYITVQKDYKDTVKKIQAGILNGSITAIDVKYENKDVTKISFTSANTFAKKEEASKNFSNLVDSKLDNLGDGDLVTFDISYDMKLKMYTEAELNTLKNKLENTILVKPASTTKAGAIEVADDNTASKPASRNVLAKDYFTFTVDKDGDTGGYKLTIDKIANVSTTTLKGFKYADNTNAEFASNGAVFADAALVTPVVIKVGNTIDSSAFTFDASNKKANDPVAEVIDADADSTVVKVINAKESTIDIDSSTSTSAEDLAKKYVFDEEALDKIYEELTTGDGYGDKVQLVSGRYQVALYPEGKRLETKGATDIENTPVKLVLKADKIKDMKDYIDDLRTYNNSYSNVVTVAGEDRIETAIELSNKYYNSDDKHAITDSATDSVVLVGSQAIVDGLVASPLASEKHAPLLLTSKDKLDSNVKSEIKRVMDLKSTSGINTSKKVYLAGGVNSISKEVENELKDMGLKVTRLSGDDRYETSLAIADEVGLDNDKAFVVGGTGLADAMSIAPVASQLKKSNGDLDATDGDATPIVVVDGKAKTINNETEDFLNNAQVDIIGGENSVSKDIEKSIEDATGKEPNRTSGDDRQATNAEVMKETDYFEKGSVINYFVAKDGSTKEDQLVDALAAAPVAANFGSTYDGKNANGTVSPAPIVLATDSLSADQNVGVSKSVHDDGGKNLVQVGKGIASSVISKMKDLLDM